MRRYHLPLLGLLLGACGGPHRAHPALAEHPVYTCCNLFFDLGRYASDANYDYRSFREGSVLPFGTRVRITDDEDGQIRFQPDGMTDDFRLAFKFGRKRMSADQWFRLILVDDDPRARVRVGPEAARVIESGQLAIGMTKAEALVARGYPPFHHTAGVEADEWLYYASPGFVDRVVFASGRIASLTHESAPQ